jgi:hypothetical protein
VKNKVKINFYGNKQDVSTKKYVFGGIFFPLAHFCRAKFFILKLRGDQEGLFKLVTLDRILNRITGVTSGCWWLVVVNAVPILDICQINQQNISSCSVIINRIKNFS